MQAMRLGKNIIILRGAECFVGNSIFDIKCEFKVHYGIKRFSTITKSVLFKSC